MPSCTQAIEPLRFSYSISHFLGFCATGSNWDSGAVEIQLMNDSFCLQFEYLLPGLNPSFTFELYELGHASALTEVSECSTDPILDVRSYT